MKNTFIKLCVLSCLIQSCASVSNIKFESQVNLQKNSLQNLNGTYQNLSSSSSNKYDHFLWHTITGQSLSKVYWKESKVILNVKSEKKITISLLDSLGKHVNSKNIKGKIVNGCFQPRRKFIAIPLIPILFGYSNQVSKLCLSDEKLQLAYSWNIWGFAMINGTKSKGSWISEHKRTVPD